MISKKQFARYALAAACAVLPVGHAIATDNYIRLYTFTPPLTVHQSGINYGEENLSFSAWNDNVAWNYDDVVEYDIFRNFLLSASFGVFRRAAEEINAIYNDGYSCYESAVAFPPSPYIGLTATTITRSNGPGCFIFILQPGSPAYYTYTFKVEGKPVTQMRTSDGSSFDALPLVVTRDGKPWQTYYFGYKMGLAAKTFDYPVEITDPQYSSYNFFTTAAFKLAKLPPPPVEGTVVEYLNTSDFPLSPGGHYFYSADASEQASVDNGGAGAFKRTGRSFKAGGYVAVCRFYGSQQPGPNSHFFTVNQGECDFLKSLQQNPVPSTVQQWNYEGQGFSENAPIPAAAADGTPTCPAGSVPVYRAYNNAWDASGKKTWDSNHRFSTDLNDIQAVVAEYGWRNEGLVMCSPQ